MINAITVYGSTAAGLDNITSSFSVCLPLTSITPFLGVITEALESVPQLDYPYALDGSSLPAWPINATCGLVQDVDVNDITQVLGAMKTYLSWFYGPPTPCLFIPDLDVNTPGDGPASPPSSWGYQSCTETLHAFSARGFRIFNFNISWAQQLCQTLWNSRVDLYSLELEFGGLQGILSTSNLIISSGGLDPWSAFYPSVLDNVALPPSVYHFHMDFGAHHLDLRSPNPAEPQQVANTRIKEQDIITAWIMAAAASPLAPASQQQ